MPLFFLSFLPLTPPWYTIMCFSNSLPQMFYICWKGPFIVDEVSTSSSSKQNHKQDTYCGICFVTVWRNLWPCMASIKNKPLKFTQYYWTISVNGNSSYSCMLTELWNMLYRTCHPCWWNLFLSILWRSPLCSIYNIPTVSQSPLSQMTCLVMLRDLWYIQYNQQIQSKWFLQTLLRNKRLLILRQSVS